MNTLLFLLTKKKEKSQPHFMYTILNIFMSLVLENFLVDLHLFVPFVDAT
jgi:hypothetical protein